MTAADVEQIRAQAPGRGPPAPRPPGPADSGPADARRLVTRLRWPRCSAASAHLLKELRGLADVRARAGLGVSMPPSKLCDPSCWPRSERSASTES